MKVLGSFPRILCVTGVTVALGMGAFAPTAATAADRGAIRACSRPSAGFFSRDAAGAP